MPTFIRTIALVLVVLTANPQTAAAAGTAGDATLPAASSLADSAGSPTPLADAGGRAAAAGLDQPPRRGMSAGWQAAGLGMLIGGVGIALYGWRAREGCYDYREYDTCGDFRRKYYAVGGVLIGSGATLLVIAESRRGRRRTSVGATDGRLTIEHRVAF